MTGQLSRQVGPPQSVYYAPRGEILSFKRGSSVYQVQADALGTVRMVTTSAGTAEATFDADALGATLAESGWSGTMRLQFVGAYGVVADSSTGLHYMRNRWYDSNLAKFASRDFLRSLNRYAYSNNNPAAFIDPLGLQAGLPEDVINNQMTPLPEFSLDAARAELRAMLSDKSQCPEILKKLREAVRAEELGLALYRRNLPLVASKAGLPPEQQRSWVFDAIQEPQIRAFPNKFKSPPKYVDPQTGQTRTVPRGFTTSTGVSYRSNVVTDRVEIWEISAHEYVHRRQNTVPHAQVPSGSLEAHFNREIPAYAAAASHMRSLLQLAELLCGDSAGTGCDYA